MQLLIKILSSDFILSLLLIVVALTVSAAVYAILSSGLRRLRHKVVLNKFKIAGVCLNAPLRMLIPAAGLLLVSPLLRVNSDARVIFTGAVRVWFMVSAGWLAVGGVRMVRDSFLSAYDITVSNNLQARSVYTQVRVIENIVNVVIVVLTLAFMLMSFEHVRQIGTSLLASAGIAGMIIGFAAQKTLANVIAGIQIAFAQPMRLDDVVIVENEWGRIEEITLTYVVVRIWDLRRLVIPISYFIEHPFQNWTRVSADILGTVFLYADYTAPIDMIRRELTRILENSLLWDKKVNCLQVTEAKEQTIEIRALMSAATSPAAWDLRCEVREKLLLFLQKNFPECLPRTRVVLTRESQAGVSSVAQL